LDQSKNIVFFENDDDITFEEDEIKASKVNEKLVKT
jgi:hypothetical protein